MNEPFPVSCSPAPDVGVRVHSAAALVNGAEECLGWECAHQLNWVFLGVCLKALFSTQCCRTAGVKSGRPDQGGHPSCFLHCSLSAPTHKVTPKTHQRNILSVQHYWPQVLGSEGFREQQRACLGRTTALPEWFFQRLIGSARGIRISFLPDVSVSLWLLAENKETFISWWQETFISILKPLFPYKNLYFLIGHHPTSLLPFSRRAAQQTAEQLLSNNQSHQNPTCLRNECLCSVIMRRSYKAQDHLNHPKTS